MPKEFYTERDIEDMFKRGILSLQVNDNVVLTELAYEEGPTGWGFSYCVGSRSNPVCPGAPVHLRAAKRAETKPHRRKTGSRPDSPHPRGGDCPPWGHRSIRFY